MTPESIPSTRRLTMLARTRAKFKEFLECIQRTAGGQDG
jgi:hypothetical protein